MDGPSVLYIKPNRRMSLTFEGRRIAALSTALLLLFSLGGIAGVAIPAVTPEEYTESPSVIHVSNDQQTFAATLLDLLDETGLTDRQRMTRSAHTAIDDREALVGEILPEWIGPMLDQQHRNLDTAGHLLDEDAAHGSDLAKTIAHAKIATMWQAEALGLASSDPIPLIGHETPSEALLELAWSHGVVPTAAELDAMRGLDLQPEAIHSSLARFIDAFIAMEQAGRNAFAEADTARLIAHLDGPASIDVLQRSLDQSTGPNGHQGHETLSVIEPPSSSDLLIEGGVDLTFLLPTRNQFLDAIQGLNDALDERGIQNAQTCAPVEVYPVFSIDLDQCDNTYTRDHALILDAGGNDVYHNNAGGSGMVADEVTKEFSSDPCQILKNPPLGVMYPVNVAALVELGEGADQYGDSQSPRSCGANGGGSVGVGFLLDDGGDDRYVADTFGTNGGGATGAGFLLDVGGDDSYTATDFGTNGGGAIGMGSLIDGGGNDRYVADGRGVNGGADIGGVAFLHDAGGNDIYTTMRAGTNGGGAGGIGYLLDASGDDVYTATEGGTNGGGVLGIGFLFDAGGIDTYSSIDVGSNGGGALGVGHLVDLDGDDRYIAGNEATNGGGNLAGVGFLFDASGDDTYIAGNEGANGGGFFNGVGLLFDAFGDDTYTAGTDGTNGGGNWFAILSGINLRGIGSLIDADGTDRYTDPEIPGGSCMDCTILQKGGEGFQIDSDDL